MYEFLYLEPGEAGTTMQYNNLLHINTKNLCLICLKECDCDKEYVKEGKLFCRILARYFGVNFMVPQLLEELQQRKEMSALLSNDNITLGDWLRFQICENCATLADKLSQQFRELELMQMKMHEYGRSFCDIMTFAEKVPNRVSRFYKTLSAFDDTSEEKAANIVGNLRKQVLFKCGSPLNTDMQSILTLPTMKVTLRKEPFLDSMASLLVPLPPSQFPQQVSYNESEEDILALMGCVVSLWVVILLALLDANELAEMWTLKLKEKKGSIKTLNSSSSPIPHLQEANSNMNPLDRDENGNNYCSSAVDETSQNFVENVRKRKGGDGHGQTDDMAGDIKKSLLESHSMDESTFDDLQILNESGTWEDVTVKQGGTEEAKEEDVQVIREVKTGKIGDYSSEEVIEDDIIKDDFMRALVRLPQTRKRKRRRRRMHEKKSTQNEMKWFSVITAEDAMKAVNAIYISNPTPADDIKIIEVEEESEVQLCFSDAKLDASNSSNLLPVANPTGHYETSTHTGYVMLMNVTTAVPPIAIDFVEQTAESTNPQILQQLTVPAAFVQPLEDKRYNKCRVCNENFQSRAQVEKHRAVDHQLTEYVECSSCFQMFTSYFHLELHRATVQKCWIDDASKKLEREDSARPIFPFEKNSIGRNFCPINDCYEVFDHMKKLNVHLKMHGFFQCRFGCTHTFCKAHELAVHEIRNHQSDIFSTSFFKCPRCDHMTEQEDGYVAHFVDQHLNISPYVEDCKVCQRGFYSMTASKSHFYMYHDVSEKDEKNIFKCDTCNGKFLKPEQLSEHRHTVHSYSVGTQQN